MIPKLFQIGPIPVYSYGLMLGISFIAASYLFSNEIKRKKLSESIAINITFIALIGGIIGAKLLYIIEEWDSIMLLPAGKIFSTEGIFSPAGLTWYGGLIFATLLILIYTRIKKIPFLKISDSTAPSLALGYGIARIGCHLSGDGDYGIPTDLPWGTIYANGIIKPTGAVREYFRLNQDLAQHFNFSELSNKVVRIDSNLTPPQPVTLFDETIGMHPTPIYELILGIVIFIILWKKRKTYTQDGKLFFLYLILSGAGRFSVEFIRINPRILFGLSEAQIVSIIMISIGVFFFYTYTNKTQNLKIKSN